MLSISSRSLPSTSRLTVIRPSARTFHASFAQNASQSLLETKLRDGLKSAMKAKDRQSATCLKTVLADITNAAKAGSDPNAPATESAVISALRKGIDKRREAAESYAPSSPSASPEQHSALTSEIDILSGYLPQAPSAESLSALVTEVIGSLATDIRNGKGAMGPAMKGVLEKLGEAAASVDRKEVGRLVQEALKR